MTNPTNVAGERKIYGDVTIYNNSGTIETSNVARTVIRTFANPAGIGSNVIVAAQGDGIKIRVLSITLFASGGANTVNFLSAAAAISATFALGAAGLLSLPFSPHGHIETLANEALNLNLTAATAVAVQITWIPTT